MDEKAPFPRTVEALEAKPKTSLKACPFLTFSSTGEPFLVPYLPVPPSSASSDEVRAFFNALLLHIGLNAYHATSISSKWTQGTGYDLRNNRIRHFEKYYDPSHRQDATFLLSLVHDKLDIEDVWHSPPWYVKYWWYIVAYFVFWSFFTISATLKWYRGIQNAHLEFCMPVSVPIPFIWWGVFMEWQERPQQKVSLRRRLEQKREHWMEWVQWRNSEYNKFSITQ